KCPACPSSWANVNAPGIISVHDVKIYGCTPYGVVQNAPDCFPILSAYSIQRSSKAFSMISVYSGPITAKASKINAFVSSYVVSGVYVGADAVGKSTDCHSLARH